MLKKIPLIPFCELFGKFAAFLFVIILTHMLTTEAYGVFSYVISLVMIASVFMDGGINNFIFNKSLKNELDEINSYFNSRLLISFVVVIILLITIYFFQRQYVYSVFLYSVFVLFNSTLSFFRMLARGQKLIKIDIQTIVLDPFFRLLLAISLYFTCETINIELIYYGMIIIEIIIFITIYFQINKIFQIKISSRSILLNLKNTISHSKYFLLYYFFFIGIQRIDIIFIEKNIDNSSVALFSSAYNIYAAIILFFTSYITSQFKNIVNTNKSGVIKIVQKLIFLCLITQILIFISSKVIFSIIYPSSYAESYIFLNYLIISLPFYIISYSTIYFLNYKNKSNYNFIILLFVFLIKFSIIMVFEFTSINQYIYNTIAFEVLISIIYVLIFIIYIKKTK